MLEEPHHPDAVERAIGERERERIGLAQCCLDACAREVSPREVELLLLNVDAEQLDTRVLLSQYRQNCADAAADLEQTCSRLERGAVANQPVPPVLSLLHEPLLLRRPVTVNVISHSCDGSHTSAQSRACVPRLA